MDGREGRLHIFAVPADAQHEHLAAAPLRHNVFWNDDA